MENWKDGYLHGVFETTFKKDQVKAAAQASTLSIGIWGALISAVTLVVAFFVIKKPLADLDKVSESLHVAGEQIDSASHEISVSSQNLSHSAT